MSIDMTEILSLLSEIECLRNSLKKIHRDFIYRRGRYKKSHTIPSNTYSAYHSGLLEGLLKAQHIIERRFSEHL